MSQRSIATEPHEVIDVDADDEATQDYTPIPATPNSPSLQRSNAFYTLSPLPSPGQHVSQTPERSPSPDPAEPPTQAWVDARTGDVTYLINSSPPFTLGKWPILARDDPIFGLVQVPDDQAGNLRAELAAARELYIDKFRIQDKLEGGWQRDKDLGMWTNYYQYPFAPFNPNC